MPRHIIQATRSPDRFEGLVKALAQELKASGGGVLPVILEQVSSRPTARYVTVIWDKWKGVPEDSRPDVILTAYERAEGKDVAESVMTAEGVTPQEALSLGLLPYSVVPVRRRNDPVPEADYKKAIAGEAKLTVLGSKATELRYPTEEAAEAAYHRLEADWPGSEWVIQQQVSAPGD